MYNISNAARQRFRQKMQNIQLSDEIIDALDEFLNRFILISNDVSSSEWSTVYIYTPNNNSATMITFSIIAKEIESGKYAGFKKTAMFYKNNNTVNALNIQQSDFTDVQEKGFGVRLIADNSAIKMQVKGLSNNLTKWKGSIQVEQHSGE